MTDHDLPKGYRWANEYECERIGAGEDLNEIVVPRTVDSSGQPYTQGEADLAVPEFPPIGARVAVTEQYETRLVGTDTMVTVSAGSIGHVEGFVEEWFDVDVRLLSGSNVWINPDRLLVLKEDDR